MKNTMNNITQFEHLSNELFLDIFEYFHAFDLFMAFSSLNTRISSILSVNQLHIVVTNLHCRHQMQFLSSHLTHHVHQVISINLQDQLRDFISVIPFFFDRHTFENLRSCTFYSICPSSNLDSVIEKLKNLNKLVSFHICQPKDILLSDAVKQDLSTTFLRCKSFELRSLDLSFRYNYPKLNTTVAMNSTLTTLRMIFRGSTIACSIFTFLPILRQYHALHALHISVSNDDNLNSPQARIPILGATYESNPPILSSLKTFDFCIKTVCDFPSLNFLLRCMPNLRRFIITIISSSSLSPIFRSMLKGDEWQRLLTNALCELDVFDIFLLIKCSDLVLDMNVIINSFDYFARKYDDWYMAIHRSQCTPHNRSKMKEITDLLKNYSFVHYLEQHISLRGFRRSKKARTFIFSTTRMVFGTLHKHATTTSDAHLFYSDCKNLHIHIPTKSRVFDISPCDQLFKKIDCLTIEIDSLILTFWKDMLDIFHIRCDVAETIQKDRADKLASLVDLSSITKLEFKPSNDISYIYFIKEVLITSTRLIQLKIGNLLIFSPLLYDDSSLISVFARIQSLYLLSKHIGFPLKHALQLVERFPSLAYLELEIYLLDICASLLNILLDGLPKLIHLKLHFQKNKTLGDGTCLINHIIKRRRQAFPSVICNQDEVSLKIDGHIMDIYLNGCSICADRKFSV